MPTPKKSAQKTAPAKQATPTVGRPFTPGADARRARGPKKGAPNAGRPPDEFKAMCAGLASRAATVTAVESILTDATHPQFMSALRWAAENGYGKPAQPMEHTGREGGAMLVRVVYGAE